MQKHATRSCPMCGGQSSAYQSMEGYYVSCYGCGIRTPILNDPRDAVSVWNRKPDLEEIDVKSLHADYGPTPMSFMLSLEPWFSRRDLFAAAALQGLLAGWSDDVDVVKAAPVATKVADALVKELG